MMSKSDVGRLLSSDLVSTMVGWAPAAFATGSAYLIARAIYNVFFHPLAKIPGPFIAKLTNLHFGLTTLRTNSLPAVLDLHQKYGPVVRVGPNALYFATPTALKTIYGTESGHRFLKSSFYDTVAGIGKNVFNERDPVRHSKMRKFLSHAFSRKALRDQEAVLSEQVDLFVGGVGRQRERGPPGASVNITNWLMFLAFDVTGDLVTGVSKGALKTGKSYAWVHSVGQMFLVGYWLDILGAHFLGPLVGMIQMLMIDPGQMTEVVEQRERVTRLVAEDERRHDMLYHVGKARKLNSSYSDTELFNMLMVFIGAGGDTVGTAMTTFFYMMAKEAELQQKLTSEIRNRFKSYDQIVFVEADTLPYLDACLQEALRIIPPVPIGPPRIATENTFIDGFFVPKDTEVASAPGALVRNPKYWHEPDVYKPERWLDPDSKDVKECSAPFSLGRRNCIAKGLALIEMKLTVARFFYVYDLELAADMDYMATIKSRIIWEKPDIEVRVKCVNAEAERDLVANFDKRLKE